MGRTTRRQAFATPSVRSNRTGFTSKTMGHDYMGGGADPHLAADLALTKRIAAVLEIHYPGHPWMVEVSHANGCVFISLPVIMKRNQKYVLHIDALKTDPSLRSVMRAAGEILERHNVPRLGFGLDHFLAARAAGPFGRRSAPKIILE